MQTTQGKYASKHATGVADASDATAVAFVAFCTLRWMETRL